MSSINFNSAATQALRTLQTSNAALDSTQKRIATGLAIGEAKDNAAYWSISTTMKSDNKALSTVTDALGLGAATVDTAYQGLSAAKDVLDEIKSKLTAALGSNVDRSAIQAEIDSLQEQLKSIASSSTFSGENWLSVNSSLSSYSANKTVVSSFTRDVSGNVTVGEIKFDSATAVLFDANAGATTKGILDTAGNLSVKIAGVDTPLTFGGPGGVSGNTSTAGFVTSAANPSGTVAASGSVGKGTQTFAFDATKLKIGDTVSFNVSTDGTTPTTNTVSLKITAANKANAAAFASALNTAINNVSAIAADVEAVDSGSNIVIQTQTTGTSAAPKQVKISAITATDSTTSTLGLAAPGTNATGNGTTKSTLDLGTYALLNGAEGDTVSVTVKLTGGTARTAVVTLTAAMLADATTGATAFANELNTQLDLAGGGNTDFNAVVTGGKIVVETTAGSSTAFDTTATAISATNASTTVGTIDGTTATGTGVETFVTRAKTTFDTFTAVTLDADDSLVVNFGGVAHTINKTAIDAAVPGANGNIADVDKMVDVLNSLGTKNYVASKVAGKLVMTSSTDAGTATVSAVTATAGPPGSQAKMSVDAIDITDTTLNGLGATDADKRVQAITAYINVVNSAINKVTAAATAIGSIGKRIDLQQTFVQNLMDTIDKGISGLVDADMNEESTKLQALQVKQQLGVQALSIANQSAQNVLSLFRG